MRKAVLTPWFPVKRMEGCAASPWMREREKGSERKQIEEEKENDE